MKLLNKIGDWIVAKPYRYWLAMWVLYTGLFLCSSFTVAIILAAIMK